MNFFRIHWEFSAGIKMSKTLGGCWRWATVCWRSLHSVPLSSFQPPPLLEKKTKTKRVKLQPALFWILKWVLASAPRWISNYLHKWGELQLFRLGWNDFYHVNPKIIDSNTNTRVGHVRTWSSKQSQNEGQRHLWRKKSVKLFSWLY